ncbi:NRDE family protein [Ornithinibacillus halophilus]|uniref:Uncharacterized conserved protein, contains NRDE domain n=1 Tax=Ornithinibacillus halophilus TaxID=930117 RepID=A0A1M5HSM5_9BACI|nr:NRDE family protein [Ornithinibacillus halophilus]SHG18925.1 Uncharacterized conserved protein, contains NRDE domain [Ornithinibacillus halophilus]
MCLINFQFHDHPQYKLIVAANRDEFYKRPTASAHFWEDEPVILAGRDLQQMGTWLGVTKQGRFAALTNFRHPDHMGTGGKSRGEIVKNYLSEDLSTEEYITQLRSSKEDFVGYNVLVGSPEELFYYNNVEDTITKIEPGTYGLSNHFLNTPWPKVVKGTQNLKNYTKDTSKVDEAKLFELLLDAEESAEEELPNTGIGRELEKKLSPLFIKLPDYGTRCSTVLTIDYKNNLTFVERNYEHGILKEEKQFSFKIEN